MCAVGPDLGRRAGARPVGAELPAASGLRGPAARSADRGDRGRGGAPAYRGTAYVVFENLDLTPFGNRIPQFNFEVFRRPAAGLAGVPRSPALDVRGVALVPGTGEYALATEPVHFMRGKGENAVLNVHNDRGLPDLVASLDQLAAELAEGAVGVAGGDLVRRRPALRPLHAAAGGRAGDRGRRPDAVAWCRGRPRSAREVVSRVDGRPVFGGTPADASVLQAIAQLKADGQSVMFYPFILMDIQAGNGLADPWTRRGRPAGGAVARADHAGAGAGAAGVDRQDRRGAADEVAAFFGQAQAVGFRSVGRRTVAYHGPAEWSYRRFILHYAHLCALAGGVDAFCIGSEMRGADADPRRRADLSGGAGAARAGRGCAGDPGAGREDRLCGGLVGVFRAPAGRRVGRRALPSRSALGVIRRSTSSASTTTCRCRTGATVCSHADAAAGSIYDLGYLTGNVAGGEGFDWYYADAAGREAQDRRPIVDGAYGEDWVFRYKDLVSWWSQPARQPPGRGEGAARRPRGSRGRSRSGSPSSAARR